MYAFASPSAMPRSPASLRWLRLLSRSIEVRTPSTIAGSPVSLPGSLTLWMPPQIPAEVYHVHCMNVKGGVAPPTQAHQICVGCQLVQLRSRHYARFGLDAL